MTLPSQPSVPLPISVRIARRLVLACARICARAFPLSASFGVPAMARFEPVSTEGASLLADSSELVDLLDVGDEVDEVAPTSASREQAPGVVRPKRELENAAEQSPKAPRVKAESEGYGASPSSSANETLDFAIVGKRRIKGAPPLTAAEVSCEGCRRIRGVSPDFLIVGETCSWAHPSGKGSW